MLMMLALRLAVFVQGLGRTAAATLLCVQSPGDGTVTVNGFPADAGDARPAVR